MTPEQLEELQHGAIEDLWEAYAHYHRDDGMLNQELTEEFIGCFKAAARPNPVPEYLTTESLLETAIEQGILDDDTRDEDEQE